MDQPTISRREKSRLLGWLKTTLEPSPEVVKEGGLTYWRERILLALITVGMLAGMIIYVTSMVLVFKHHLWTLGIIDSVAYGWCLLLFFTRKKLAYTVRACMSIPLFYLIGVAVLFQAGPVSGGPIWLFAFAVIVGVLLGVRATIAALMLNAVTLTVFGVLVVYGYFSYIPPTLLSNTKWAVLGVNFIFLNSLAAISVALLLRGLDQALSKEKVMIQRLHEQKNRLGEAYQNLEREAADRRRAELARQRSDERFRRSFENSAIGMVMTDCRGCFLEANAHFCWMVGYTSDELLDMSMAEITHPDDQAMCQDAMNKVLSGKLSSVRFEQRYRHRDGRLLWASVSSSLLDHDHQGKPLCISHIQDITERKMADDALRESEQCYQDLFNSITDIIFTHDMEGRLLTINQAGIDTLGYPRDHLVGKPIKTFILPSYHEKFYSHYMTGIEANGHVSGTTSFVNRDGNERYLEYTSVLVKGSDGESYVSGSCREVTERILAERELRQVEEQLMQSQKMEAVGTLASGIAHDFNNILQAIRGYLDIIAIKWGPATRTHQQLQQIDHLVDRAAKLVRGLLTFGRKMEAELKPVDLNQEIKRTVQLLERTIPKMIQIETDLAPDIKLIKGDANQLEQVLMNLGANARDAMPEGGRLIIATRNYQGEPATSRKPLSSGPEGYVLLTVSDTGHGMNKETVSQIFNPFFTTKDVSQGTGLGLSTVFGIIKEHGGEITCESRPGQGTTFHILLPALATNEYPEDVRPSNNSSLPRGEELILVVDDEQSIRETVTGALAIHGYQVITANNGEQALDIFADRRDEIALVILDLGMPGMGGIACLRRMQAADPQVKVLVASGYIEGTLQQEDINAQTVDFLPKPYRMETMVTKVREMLDGPYEAADPG